MLFIIVQGASVTWLLPYSVLFVPYSIHNQVQHICRNILKSNDVRTGLKKPEQESKKRAASGEAAHLADSAETADVAAAADRPAGSTAHAAGAPADPETAQAANHGWVVPLVCVCMCIGVYVCVSVCP